MMLLFRLLIFILITPFIVFSQERGDVISFEKIQTFSIPTLQLLYSFNNISTEISPINNAVELYRVNYYTPEPKQKHITEASGLLYIPIEQTRCNYPIFSCQHGTTALGKAPSLLNTEAYLLPIPFAADGYIGVLADYVGYGITPDSIPHVYLHSKSEATATIDMIRASKKVCNSLNINYSEQLFLSGYSQGGHVTLAAQKEIQEFHNDEFKVVASAPGSGPYILHKDVLDSALTTYKYSRPLYLTFLIESYNYIYDFYESPNDIYLAPYDSLVPLIYNRSNPIPVSILQWPAHAYLSPPLKIDIQNKTHPLYNALIVNDLSNWKSETPINLYYCEADEQVPYTVSLQTADQMTTVGSNQVDAILVDANLNHADCARPTLELTKQWFDELKGDCNVVGELNKSTTPFISFYPNPAYDVIHVSKKFNKRPYSILTMKSIQVKQGEVANNTINIKDLNNGQYILRIDEEAFTFQKK